jgi:hypothetical protein
LEQFLDLFVVHEFGAVDFGLKHEAFGDHKEVALAALDLLATIVSSLLSSYTATLDRLRIHYAGTGLGISSGEPAGAPRALG